MLICRGNTAYKCSELKKKSFDDIKKMQFCITDSVSPEELKDLFEDDTFYFYDEVYKCNSIETNNTQLVGLSITYNADSTCNITMKLKRRSG